MVRRMAQVTGLPVKDAQGSSRKFLPEKSTIHAASGSDESAHRSSSISEVGSSKRANSSPHMKTTEHEHEGLEAMLIFAWPGGISGQTSTSSANGRGGDHRAQA